MAIKNYLWVIEWKPEPASKWLSTCDVALTRADVARKAKGWRGGGNKIRIVKYTSQGKNGSEK